MNRRQFTRIISASGLYLGLSTFYACADKSEGLDILVLGGTQFVGPAIVHAALAQNHRVTLFNRGITNPSLFSQLPLIKGNRENGSESYKPLLNKNWDVVIDVWPEKSNLVEEATLALKNNTKHYAFISSIAVYNDFQEVGLNEVSETLPLNPDRSNWGYSEEKLSSELAVIEQFPEHHTILRPGPIKGWRDPAVDLLYWCYKVKNNDHILAPGSGNDPIQFVDVKDVGGFLLFAIQNQFSGIYNCVGPAKETPLWKDFLSSLQDHFGSESKLFWANEEFLRTNEVYSFSDLPLWAPLSEDRGFMQISNQKMMETGYELIPIESTFNDTWNWHAKNNNTAPQFGSPEIGIGLSAERENKLLEQLM